ncbi:DUF418 domain-containing protein [Bacillus sp. CDB3]|uniref:DUF418 domain-containing protein n=1 Tax=Bacillus sp. CDB3 TaxID=360310 RepID=UPI0009D7CE27|nr:DUF418 domain-containing protein [Bacillus sp. CDB3]OQR53493.1 hypothetical protein CDB3_29405 [Bacillus sp. CDB3]
MNTTKNISTRMMSLDIIRGFALLGVLIAHAPMLSKDPPFLKYSTDFYLLVFNDLFINLKFVSIYSFLFGIGSQVFFSRTQQRGLQSKKLFSRRLITLLPIGMIPILMGSPVTPILITYSLLGFILLPFFKLKPRIILSIAGILASCSMIFMIATMVSTKSLGIFAIKYMINYNLLIISMFFLGLYVGKINLFQQLSQKMSIIKQIHKISFFLSLPLILGGLWVAYISPSPNVASNIIFRGIGIVASYPLSIFYVSSILILYNKNYFMYIFQPLSYVGRISLTAYVGHLLLIKLCVSLLGWTNGYTLVQSWILVCIVFTILSIFSFVWVQKFQQGPLEKIWRIFTYGKLSRFNKGSGINK